MSHKWRLVFGIGLLVLLLVLAMLAYNTLSKRVNPYDDLIGLDQSGSQAAQDQDDPSSGSSGQTDNQGASPGSDETDNQVGSSGTGQSGDQDLSTDASDMDRMKAPDFSMQDWNGGTVSLSDLVSNGKPIALNFWASWCPPCKSEMPDFEVVYGELGGKVQFAMVCLTDGQRETVDTGAQYIKDNGYSFPVFYDTDREGAIAYGVTSIPTTFVIDKDGFIATGAVGAIDENTLRRFIEAVL